MAKSIALHTAVLGGKIALRGNALYGDVLQDTLFPKEQIEALQKRLNPRRPGVRDLRTGQKEVPDACFIWFGNTVLERLHFHEAGPGPKVSDPMENLPGVIGLANAARISFHVKDDITLDAFAVTLEQECDQRSIKVARNRIITARSEVEQRQASARCAANKLWNDPDCFVEGHSDADFGDFQSWSLFYCKGPNGEQLEFNQATRAARAHFPAAQREDNASDGTDDNWSTITLQELTSARS